MGWVLMETLRVTGPAVTSMGFVPTQDVTLGKYSFTTDDNFMICMRGLQLNPKEWQRPMEIIPKRFDNNGPISLTPDVKKRHPNSYAPFYGGPRVCFGKTLAEGELKLFASYMNELFDMEFVDEKYQNKVPEFFIMQSFNPSTWLKLKARK